MECSSEGEPDSMKKSVESSKRNRPKKLKYKTPLSPYFTKVEDIVLHFKTVSLYHKTKMQQEREEQSEEERKEASKEEVVIAGTPVTLTQPTNAITCHLSSNSSKPPIIDGFRNPITVHEQARAILEEKRQQEELAHRKAIQAKNELKYANKPKPKFDNHYPSEPELHIKYRSPKALNIVHRGHKPKPRVKLDTNFARPDPKFRNPKDLTPIEETEVSQDSRYRGNEKRTEILIKKKQLNDNNLAYIDFKLINYRKHYYNVKYSAKSMVPIRLSKRIYVDPESQQERKDMRHPHILINNKISHLR